MCPFLPNTTSGPLCPFLPNTTSGPERDDLNPLNPKVSSEDEGTSPGSYCPWKDTEVERATETLRYHSGIMGFRFIRFVLHDNGTGVLACRDVVTAKRGSPTKRGSNVLCANGLVGKDKRPVTAKGTDHTFCRVQVSSTRRSGAWRVLCLRYESCPPEPVSFYGDTCPCCLPSHRGPGRRRRDNGGPDVLLPFLGDDFGPSFLNTPFPTAVSSALTVNFTARLHWNVPPVVFLFMGLQRREGD